MIERDSLLSLEAYAKQRPQFRATGARVQPLEPGTVGMTAETRQRLGVEPGEAVWMAPA